MSSCVFCKVLEGDLPSEKVYEDASGVAFLDINPISKGHTLVIPKGHYALLSQIPEKEFLKFMNTVQKVVKGLLQYSDGVSVVQNNGTEAGQVVPHVHFHIIPRRQGDGLRIGEWKAQHDPELENVRKVIQSILND